MEEENKTFYAELIDEKDFEYDIGSYDKNEAEREVVCDLRIFPEGHIAVVENGICVRKIWPLDFSPIYSTAYKVITSDSDEEREMHLSEMAKLLKMTKKWEKTEKDTDKRECIIKEMCDKIRVNLTEKVVIK